MKALRIFNLLLLAVLIAPLAAQEDFTPYSAKVNSDSVRLRSGPSLAHPPILVTEQGDELIVTGEENGWAVVRLPAKAPCWIAAEFASLGEDGKIYTVTGDNVNLRVSPDTSYFPVGQASKGQALTAVTDGDSDSPTTDGDYVKVVPPSNAHGAIAVKFLDKVKDLDPEELKQTEKPAEPAAEGEPAIEVPTEKEPGREPTPEELEDERKTFRELESMLDEELKKPAAEVNLTGIRNMFEQFKEFALDKDVRDKSRLYIEKIDLTVKLIESERQRINDEEARRKAEVERIAEEALKEEEEDAEEQPKGPVEYLATGRVGSHGKSAQTPASHRLYDADGNVLYDLRWDKGNLAKLMGSNVGIVGTVKKYDGWPHKVVIIERIDVIDDGETK